MESISTETLELIGRICLTVVILCGLFLAGYIFWYSNKQAMRSREVFNPRPQTPSTEDMEALERKRSPPVLRVIDASSDHPWQADALAARSKDWQLPAFLRRQAE